jgi:hypothetical protein
LLATNESHCEALNPSTVVMAGLRSGHDAPATDRIGGEGRVDHRVKPGDDDFR